MFVALKRRQKKHQQNKKKVTKNIFDKEKIKENS